MSVGFKKSVKQWLMKRPFCAIAFARIATLMLALRASIGLCFRFPYAYIARDVRLIGISRIRLGKNVAIGRGSWLNVNDQKSPTAALSIGDNCFIGQHNFFTVGRSIVLRDYCLTAANCAFIGSAHRYSDPMRSYLAAGTMLNQDIYVGANCFFGLNVQVLGNVRIGHGCVIGAGAVVRGDVPPFSLVVGNPGKVVKRFDFASGEWVKWPCEGLREGPPEEEYIQHLREKHGFLILPVSVAATFYGNIM